MRQTLHCLALTVLLTAASCQTGKVSAADARADLISARESIQQFLNEYRRDPYGKLAPTKNAHKDRIDDLCSLFEEKLHKARRALPGRGGTHAQNVKDLRDYLNILKENIEDAYNKPENNAHFYGDTGDAAVYFMKWTQNAYSGVLSALASASSTPTP